MADLSTTAGADYTAVSGTLTFAPGDSTQTITIPIIDDLVIEEPNPEFALVNLSNPTNAVLGDPQGTLRIFDNDGPSVFESGLPDGSNPEPADLVADGVLDLSEFDDINIQAVRVDGQDVTGGGTISTPFGQLEIAEDNGSYSWTYTLQNTSGHDQAPGNVNFEAFSVEIVGEDGVPRDADLVFDVRFLRNPHYDLDLRPLTGLDDAVGDHVAGDPDFDGFFNHLTDLLEPLLPRYAEEGKSYLTIAVGCTGGRHRSVCVTEDLSAWVAQQGEQVHVRHRDL